MLRFKVTGQPAPSPSVTVEKGTYRIRSPSSLRPLDTRPIARKKPPNRPSTFLALLIVLLASACLTCFGVAYYLYSTRWARSDFLDTSSADEKYQVVEFDLDSDLIAYHKRNDPNETFLAYLPHSGFNNQRIAFENALVLSRLLNRTLLVPPVRLGNRPISYMKFETLYKILSHSGKEGLRHCGSIQKHQVLPLECFDYYDYTNVPWDWLINLTEIRAHQHLLQRWNMTREWIRDQLGIQDDDILTLNDSDRYNYRFIDNRSPLSVSKYKEEVNIQSLFSSKRLIQLGTLFGSSRLYLKDSANLEIRTLIRRSMVFSNDRLEEASNSIVQLLNGDYLGAHMRLGDGRFVEEAQRHSQQIWTSLVQCASGSTINDLEEVLTIKPTLFTVTSSFSKPMIAHANDTSNLSPSKISCRRPRHNQSSLAPLNIPLYISTDADNPIVHPSFQAILHTFPCTFFLSDFQLLIDKHLNLKNGYDGLPLRVFLLPFLDAMVVGKARKMVGTEGSTFSSFIKDVLWTTYHGQDLVQRG